VRDERALARQRELREEAKQLEDKASSTPGDRERLEEIRAGLVSDGAYAGLKERVAERGGSPESGAAEGQGGSRSHDHGTDGATQRRPASPMWREINEHQQHALLYNPRPAPKRPDRERPRIDAVEQARALVLSGDRPPPPAPPEASVRDSSTRTGKSMARPSDEIRPPWAPPPRPEEER
jgi:hypothetical protein